MGEGAFSECDNLTSIIIPSSVTSIEKDAFKECSLLDSVVFKGNNPPKLSSDYPFAKIIPFPRIEFIVPKGAKSAYIKAGYPSMYIIEQ